MFQSYQEDSDGIPAEHLPQWWKPTVFVFIGIFLVINSETTDSPETSSTPQITRTSATTMSEHTSPIQTETTEISLLTTTSEASLTSISSEFTNGTSGKTSLFTSPLYYRQTSAYSGLLNHKLYFKFMLWTGEGKTEEVKVLSFNSPHKNWGWDIITVVVAHDLTSHPIRVWRTY